MLKTTPLPKSPSDGSPPESHDFSNGKWTASSRVCSTMRGTVPNLLSSPPPSLPTASSSCAATSSRRSKPTNSPPPGSPMTASSVTSHSEPHTAYQHPHSAGQRGRYQIAVLANPTSAISDRRHARSAPCRFADLHAALRASASRRVAPRRALLRETPSRTSLLYVKQGFKRVWTATAG